MSLSRVRRLGFILFVALLLAACSINGGDDDDQTATEEPAPELTATEAPDPTETEPPTAEPTATATATSTATSTPTATPEPTATPTATSTPTPTPIPIVENPFVDAPSPDLVLDNYTVTYTATISLSDDTTEEVVDIFIEQSSPNRYHLRSSPDVEIWVIDDATYFRNPDDGSVFQVPTAVDPGLVSPAAYLIQVPSPASIPQGRRLGEEDVAGRPATHYEVDAEHFQLLGLAEGGSVIDPEGDINIWVDSELGFISRMTVSVTWQDEAGVERSAEIELLVSNVGTTAEIAPPI